MSTKHNQINKLFQTLFLTMMLMSGCSDDRKPNKVNLESFDKRYKNIVTEIHANLTKTIGESIGYQITFGRVVGDYDVDFAYNPETENRKGFFEPNYIFNDKERLFLADARVVKAYYFPSGNILFFQLNKFSDGKQTIWLATGNDLKTIDLSKFIRILIKKDRSYFIGPAW